MAAAPCLLSFTRTTAAAAFCPHLEDVLLDPVIHAIAAVPPDVGLLRDELAGLQGGREKGCE
jgi:hypothetical protein